MLPKNNRLRKVFADEWRPALSLMHDAAKHLICRTDTRDMNSRFFETTMVAARSGLEEKYPHLFDGNNLDKGRQWKVSTWSKKIREENRRQKKERLLQGRR